VKKALGKGLNALLPATPQNDESIVVELDIGKIEPNPEQPRKNFDAEAMRQLAESIASVGVVQPIIVTDEGDYYKIIAGERRWRAARKAGLTTIPAIVRHYSKVRGVEIALIENLQRQDLNPIEEANGYERLISEYGYTQEKIAQTVGKSRPAIANSIRLLKLSGHIKELISGGAISAGHARSLLAVESEERRNAIADDIVARDLNVRQTEIIVGRETSEPRIGKKILDGGVTSGDTRSGSSGNAGGDGRNGGNAGGNGRNGNYADNDVRGGSDAGADTASDTNVTSGVNAVPGGGSAASLENASVFERETTLKRIEDELRSRFNTRVSLSDSGGKTGRIIIEYYSDDDLQRLLEQFGLGIGLK